MEIRQVDSAQFQRRLNTYDFDMIPFTWYNSLSPGNEQTFYWGSAGRTQEGTRNYMGADDPAIDKMIAELLAARDEATFKDAARGLDRLLLEGHYVLQLFHAPGQWVARWNTVQRPETPSLYGFRPETGWIAPE
jgi:peptide/nickel transport system substrate-binding protein